MLEIGSVRIPLPIHDRQSKPASDARLADKRSKFSITAAHRVTPCKTSSSPVRNYLQALDTLTTTFLCYPNGALLSCTRRCHSRDARTFSWRRIQSSLQSLGCMLAQIECAIRFWAALWA